MSKKEKSYSRRDFITKSAVGMASTAILSTAGMAKFPDSEKEKGVKTRKKGEIIYRTLGRTGIKLPIVSMGVMNALNPELVKRSYGLGVRHFDTAAYYQRGQNEKMVGSVIKELKARDQVIIGTKVYIPHEKRTMPPQQAREFFLKSADESLERLQTDYLDILYIHNVKNPEYMRNPGILEALELLKKQKKVRFLGFSTHTNMSDCIDAGVKDGFFDVILTSYNYSLADDKKLVGSIKRAAIKGVGIIAMKTQCTQYWYRQRLPAEIQQYYKGKILHSAVLKWALQNPYICTAIPGYTSFSQMEDDFSLAYGLDYTLEEKKFLQDRQIKLSLAYCRQCNHCIQTCPKAVDIPTLMRIHMYITCYHNHYLALDTLEDIPKAHNLKVCLSCNHCQASCINRVDIKQRIAELKTIYS